MKRIGEEINQMLPEIIREAGKLAMEYFSRIDSVKKSEKEDKTIVTEADTNVQDFIINKLAGLDNKFCLLAEETLNFEYTPNNIDFCWVLDPIDGTGSFARGEPEWVIAIGLLHNGAPCAGWVYQPSVSKLFCAPYGDKYAYISVNNFKEQVIKKVEKDKSYKITENDYVNVGTRVHKDYELVNFKGRTTSLGSLTLHILQTITDESIATFSYDNKIWDVCATLEMIRRVGLNISYIDGRTIDYKLVASSNHKKFDKAVIVCHSNVFEEVRKIFKEKDYIDKHNFVKKWTAFCKHKEGLYILMTALLQPAFLASIIISILGSLVLIPLYNYNLVQSVKHIGLINIFFSFVIAMFYIICTLLSRKELRRKKERYILPTFIFDLLESFVAIISVNILMLPPYNDRKTFFIIAIIYLVLRVYKVLVGKSLNINFNFILFAIMLYTICILSDMVTIEYICGLILLVTMIVFSVNLVRKLAYEK